VTGIVKFCNYQGLLVCGNLHVYKLPVPLIGPLEIDLLCV